MRRCLFLSLVVLAPLGLVACDAGDGSSCLLDSDCADFAQICVEGACRAVGDLPDSGPTDGAVVRDSGPRVDSGGMTDSGPDEDAGPTDAGGGDGGMADAAPTDGGMMACEDVLGAWTISFVSATTSCGDATVGLGVTIAAGAVACEYVATSVATAALDGTFTLAMDNSLLGDLTTGIAAAQSCSGTYNPTGGQFTFICGSCVMNLNRT